MRVTVTHVIADIRERGDTAVREYSEMFDGWSPESFRLSPEQTEEIVSSVPAQVIEDIRFVLAAPPARPAHPADRRRRRRHRPRPLPLSAHNPEFVEAVSDGDDASGEDDQAVVKRGAWLDNTRRRATKLRPERREALDALAMRW